MPVTLFYSSIFLSLLYTGMNKTGYSRRNFLQQAAMGTIAAGLPNIVSAAVFKESGLLTEKGKRIGIIGLDTSHSTAFVKALNVADADADYLGYKVVAAYPWGSKTIQSSRERIPAYTEEVKKSGVAIVDSIDALLKTSDVIMLETNDGHPHLEQAIQVMKAGKTLFIDKPVAASLTDVLTIYKAAEKYKVPVFSSSSLRYTPLTQDIAAGKTVGKVLGADAYSPCELEPSHPDFFWYGIHGIELLFTVMGKGCKEVRRVHEQNTDMVTGTWQDGRIGTFRGIRGGKAGYGGTAFGENGVSPLGSYGGYESLLKQIIRFFETGITPVPVDETIEIYAFMQAADESKTMGGIAVDVSATLQKAYSTITV